jgi:murein DD-endopeptidase MepM/ murein hydrolase activator NlpD
MKLLTPIVGINEDGAGTAGIYLTQRFGENLNDYAQFGMKGHNGADWAAPKGTPVRAVHDGRVEFGDDPKGYGKFARLYFDLEFTWDCIYGHFDRYEGVNRKVKAGDVVGYVDSTGFSTGHHLHFGIRKIKQGTVVDYNNGYFGYIDPLPFFKESMTNVTFVHKAGTKEYGFYVPALSQDAIKDKALNFGVDILKADGSIDFGKAKEITL